jgi:hypothetical protein
MLLQSFIEISVTVESDAEDEAAEDLFGELSTI